MIRIPIKLGKVTGGIVMNKDEILQKSRKENKDKDIFEKEVLKEAGNAAAITAAILSALFFAIQIFAGGGMNYGFWAIVFSIQAAGFTVKAIRLKRKHEIVMAILYILITLLASVSFIYDLITSSTIL
jgi:hypothetical protein